jgi:hypothetical protein
VPPMASHGLPSFYTLSRMTSELLRLLTLLTLLTLLRLPTLLTNPYHTAHGLLAGPYHQRSQPPNAINLLNLLNLLYIIYIYICAHTHTHTQTHAQALSAHQPRRQEEVEKT